jgi:phage tail protein X
MLFGKKLMVVASVLLGGAGAAFFFRKEASPVDPFQTSSLSGAFRRRIDRRAAPEVPRPFPGVGSRAPQTAQPAVRVPASTTAAIAEPGAASDDSEPTFQKNFHPVGTLLQPIDGVGADEPASDVTLDDVSERADTPLRTHVVADGDTLTQLAIRYLGQAERYTEIYQLNRGILASPDLLPIGATLRIPPRNAVITAPPAGSPRAPTTYLDSRASVLPLVPVREAPRD